MRHEKSIRSLRQLNGYLIIIILHKRILIKLCQICLLTGSAVHTRCDNRHRILSCWFWTGLLIFWISQSDTALHKFWISENKQLMFFIKINILFFLIFWKQYYKINQLWNNPKIINKLRNNNEVSWNLTVQNWTVFISLYRSLYRYRVRVPI